MSTMNLNNVNLVGRLADDVSYTEAVGKTHSRCVGRLIVNRIPGPDGKSSYDAIPIVAWDKHADAMARYTRKGKELTITGEIRVNNVPPTQEGGEWKNYTEVLVRTVSFGRDSNQEKAMKAVTDLLGEANEPTEQSYSLATLLSNPKLRERLTEIAATAASEQG